MTQLAKWQGIRNRLVHKKKLVKAPITLKPSIKPVAINPLAKLKKRKNKGDPYGYDEMDRILSIPIHNLLSEAEADKVSQKVVLAGPYNDPEMGNGVTGFRLNIHQASGLLGIDHRGGIVAPMGVGSGKTLLTLLLAQKYYELGHRKIALCIPPDLHHQLTKVDIPWARRRVVLNVPFMFMGNLHARKRMQLARSGKKGVYVLPYSCLSNRDADEILTNLGITVFILDEAHNLANRSSARTKRFLRHADATEAGVSAMSGTLTSKSIHDYHHLAVRALGEGCPMPRTAMLMGDWAQRLDSTSSGGAGPLDKLVNWARKYFPEDEYPFGQFGFRMAYKHRLRSTPGVIATGDKTLGVSLTIANLPVPKYETAPGYDLVERYMDDVIKLMMTPNGDDIDFAIHNYKWLSELSAGFYNSLFWPNPDVFAARKKISVDAARDIIERSIVHHELRNVYDKSLRQYLDRNPKPGYDTPFLVGGEFNQHGDKNLPTLLYMDWADAKKADFPERIDRDSEAIRLSDYKIKHALAWAKSLKGESGIIWYHHREIGKWLDEIFEEDGIKYSYCPSGSVGSRKIEEAVKDPIGTIMLASQNGHGTGKNLQACQNNFFMQFPRQAKQAEQVIGRTHREGQMADELRMVTCNTTSFDHESFASMLHDSLYIQQSLGSAQRPIFANYVPTPTIFPQNVLTQRGYEVKKLSPRDQKLLQEMFGTARV